MYGKITIRKADKANVYVILDSQEYVEKLDSLLSDQSKFEQLISDPTNNLKVEANKIINEVNGNPDNFKLKKITGEYSPGYIYGNVKIHKEGNPIRPIISQISTPTYELSKTLDNIIKPYIPSKYMLKSREELLGILHSNTPQGQIASLDVTSLFTNVPVEDTIEIILDKVYNSPDMNPPSIPKEQMEKLLKLCTTKCPFYGPCSKIYIQKDGVSMGSCLGPTFANFYMANLENKVLKGNNHSPEIYTRYVDRKSTRLNSSH